MRVTVGGRDLLNFCSNDYLGLSQHLDVVAALQEGSAWHGVGGSASALVSGHHVEHAALEDECAEWMGYPRGLLFGSGYLANLAVMQSLLERRRRVRAGQAQPCLPDRRRAPVRLRAQALPAPRCRRRDAPAGQPQAMARRCWRPMACSAWMATWPRCATWPCWRVRTTPRFLVDDAHGIGVIGPDGRGSTAVANLNAKRSAPAGAAVRQGLRWPGRDGARQRGADRPYRGNRAALYVHHRAGPGAWRRRCVPRSS